LHAWRERDSIGEWLSPRLIEIDAMNQRALWYLLPSRWILEISPCASVFTENVSPKAGNPMSRQENGETKTQCGSPNLFALPQRRIKFNSVLSPSCSLLCEKKSAALYQFERNSNVARKAHRATHRSLVCYVRDFPRFSRISQSPRQLANQIVNQNYAQMRAPNTRFGIETRVSPLTFFSSFLSFLLAWAERGSPVINGWLMMTRATNGSFYLLCWWNIKAREVDSRTKNAPD